MNRPAKTIVAESPAIMDFGTPMPTDRTIIIE